MPYQKAKSKITAIRQYREFSSVQNFLYANGTQKQKIILLTKEKNSGWGKNNLS